MGSFELVLFPSIYNSWNLSQFQLNSKKGGCPNNKRLGTAL